MPKYVLFFGDDQVYVKSFHTQEKAKEFVVENYPDATEDDPLDPYHEDYLDGYADYGEVCAMWEINDFLENWYLVLLKC